ncbi:MAG: NAD(P)H-hydrate dehydratase [Gammaproteobacteria bacterium]
MEQQPILLYRTDHVRDMDRYAIDVLGVDGYLLMTRAAQASLDLLRSAFAGARTVLVVCGAGNNAGDGYVLARLAMDTGMRVRVLAVSAPEMLKGDALRAWQDFVDRGGQVDTFDEAMASRCDVIVDALLGTGLNREVSGAHLRAIHWMNQGLSPVLSLDVPSGLNSDTGLAQPVAVRASFTPTFIALKIGLYTGRASTYCGDIKIYDLDIPSSVATRFEPVARILVQEDVRTCLPPRRHDAHKGVHGRVLIVGGNAGMSGAVVLAAAAALRSGAGTVTVACHPDNRQIVAASMPEIMCVGVECAQVLEVLLDGCDVVAVGPGLGRDDWAQALLDVVLSRNLPLVIDADGLRLVAKAGRLPEAGVRIVTPHPGEAAALGGKTNAEVQESRLETARWIAHRYNAVVALKGAGTVVVKPVENPLVDTAAERSEHEHVTGVLPAEETAVCNLGNPGMATAGTGDVLTGIVAGIWAQQSRRDDCAFEVTCAAVYVHAEAGDKAAIDGERGLIASDLLAQVRQCVNINP